MRSKGPGWVVLASLAVAVAIKAYHNPLPTFDRLLYAAAVANLHTSDPTLIAQEAFRSAGQTDYPHTAFTDTLLEQPTLIVEQIPFYANRPLYIYALAAVGLWWVSPMSYLGIILVLALWIRNPWWVIPMALLPDLLAVAREITPDALSAFAVLGALLLLRRNHTRFALTVLLLSLGVRTDNLFFLLPVAVILAWKKKLRWTAAVGFAGLGIAGVAAIDLRTHNYGWIILIRHSFTGGLVHPALANAPISPHDYLGYLLHGTTGLFSIGSLWALLGALAWHYSKPSRDFLLIAALFCVFHILVFPISEPRYFITAFLLVYALFVEAFTNIPRSHQHKTLDRSGPGESFSTSAAQKSDEGIRASKFEVWSFRL